MKNKQPEYLFGNYVIIWDNGSGDGVEKAT
jgi:hypothetical protein